MIKNFLIINCIGKNDKIGAFADDIWIVAEDIISLAPLLARLFHSFSLASHLTLNLDKCVLVPLCRFSAGIWTF